MLMMFQVKLEFHFLQKLILVVIKKKKTISTPGPLYNTVRHSTVLDITDHSWIPNGHILLYLYIFYSCYNTDWIANMKNVLDPNNSVIKRLWCTFQMAQNV